MNNVAIAIELAPDVWEYLDLMGTEELITTYAVNRLNSIETRQGYYTETFEIVLTSGNRRRFGIPDDIHVYNELPYTPIPCRVESGGTVELFGTLVLKEVNDKATIEITGGNYDFFTAIAEKNLTDLSLRKLDHKWTYENVLASQGNTWEDGYIYSVIDYGRFGQREDVRIRFDELYPAVYVRTVLEAMARSAGYRLTGGFLNNSVFNREILPMSKEPYLPEDFGKKRSCLVSVDTLGGFTRFNEDFDLILPLNLEEGNKFFDGEMDNFNPLIYTYTAKDLCIANVKANIPCLLGSDAFGTGEVRGRILVNGLEIGYNATKDDGAHNLQPEIKGLIMYPGDTIQVKFEARKVTLGGDYTFTLFLINKQTDNFLPTQLRVDVQDLFIPGMTWDMGKNLPDMKQSDFLLSLVNQFNLVLSNDVERKILTMEEFNTVVDNIPDAKDWSEKVDFAEAPTISFVKGEYGQESWFRYQEDDEDELLNEYRKMFNVPYGDSYIKIPNLTLPNREDVFVSEFAATRYRNGLAYVPMVSEKEDTRFSIWSPLDTYNTSPIQDYVVYKGRYFRQLKNGSIGNAPFTGNQIYEEFWVEGSYLDYIGKGLFPTNNIVPRVLLVDPTNLAPANLLVEGTENSYTEYVANTSFEPLAFGRKLLQNYYRTLEANLQQPKYVRCLMKLSSLDIATLDFFRPVWIASNHPRYGRMFNAYFFISVIDQYPHGRKASCYVELFRLDDASRPLPEFVEVGGIGYLLVQDGGYLLYETSGKIPL